MIVVDTETTGVDYKLCSLLSIGAVDFENSRNTFYIECRAFDGAHIEKGALEVNGFTETDIFDKNKPTDEEAVRNFLGWAASISERTLAGQNPAFDRDFIQQTAYRTHVDFPWSYAHRTIDLHSICYFHMLKRGVAPPTDKGHTALNTNRILEYIGLPKREGVHNALRDAILEAEVFSRLINDKPMFEEFSNLKIPWLIAK